MNKKMFGLFYTIDMYTFLVTNCYTFKSVKSPIS